MFETTSYFDSEQITSILMVTIGVVVVIIPFDFYNFGISCRR